MASLELGSGTTRGQGAFREGPPEGEAGQGCARPVADVPGSVAERGSTSICLPSRPVCCCEGSQCPPRATPPELAFPRSLVSDPCGREGFRPSDDTWRAVKLSDTWAAGAIKRGSTRAATAALLRC